MNADKAPSPFAHLFSSVFIGGFFLFLWLTFGCDRRESREVVLYTSIDQPVAAPIVREFEKQTGIQVTLVTDTEATKSVGLAERLRAERANPQADVWWSNEIFHTINLADDGFLQPYDSPAASEVPDRFKDHQHLWTGNATRVRALVVHTVVGSNDTIIKGELPDLLLPNLKGMIAIARPTAGTTGGHVAALYVLWGDDRADRFFRDLHANGVKLLGGNSAVAESVARGSIYLGLADNDDVSAAAREVDPRVGIPDMILPDQKSFGTLVIPTTVGLVAGAKHASDAKLLIDYLLLKQVEQKLIDAKFAYGGVRAGVGPAVKGMEVDYRAVAKKLPEAVRRSTAILEGRE